MFERRLSRASRTTAVTTCLVAAVALIGSAAAQQQPRYTTDETVSNWRSEARAHLEIGDGGPTNKPVVAGQVNRRVLGRCALINNYWCTKHPKGDRYEGTVPPHQRARTEEATFAMAEAGARAAVRNLRSKYFFGQNKDGKPLRTVRQLSCAQAPSDGCRGDIVDASGRCTKGRNDCNGNAVRLAQAMGVGPDEQLQLFQGANPVTARATTRLRSYLRALSAIELTPDGRPRTLRIWATRALIERGIRREHEDYARDNRRPRAGS